MAGDWIKMRSNLWDDPRVASLCDATDQPESMVIGGLYWLWSTADQHTEDGCMPGLTMRAIDRKTGISGFSAALVAIDWLHDDPQGVVVARFGEHNGASAKRRCAEAQRKASGRSGSAIDADTERTTSGVDADELQTPCVARVREEKRREEKDNTLAEADLFAEFWMAYPRKVAKDAARKAFAKRKPTRPLVDAMLAAISAQVRSEQWTKDAGQFIPHPATWLNAGRWEDVIEPPPGAPSNTVAENPQIAETRAAHARLDAVELASPDARAAAKARLLKVRQDALDARVAPTHQDTPA